MRKPCPRTLVKTGASCPADRPHEVPSSVSKGVQCCRKSRVKSGGAKKAKAHAVKPCPRLTVKQKGLPCPADRPYVAPSKIEGFECCRKSKPGKGKQAGVKVPVKMSGAAAPIAVPAKQLQLDPPGPPSFLSPVKVKKVKKVVRFAPTPESTVSFAPTHKYESFKEMQKKAGAAQKKADAAQKKAVKAVKAQVKTAKKAAKKEEDDLGITPQSDDCLADQNWAFAADLDKQVRKLFKNTKGKNPALVATDVGKLVRKHVLTMTGKDKEWKDGKNRTLKIEKYLAEGVYGTVSKATFAGKPVILKVFKRTGKTEDEFQMLCANEMFVQSTLHCLFKGKSHNPIPKLVAPFRMGKDMGFAMADAGTTFFSYLEDKKYPGKAAERRAAQACTWAELVKQTAGVVKALQDKVNIRHNDLHPGNVLVNKQGLVSIIDFGYTCIDIHGEQFRPFMAMDFKATSNFHAKTFFNKKCAHNSDASDMFFFLVAAYVDLNNTNPDLFKYIHKYLENDVPDTRMLYMIPPADQVNERYELASKAKQTTPTAVMAEMDKILKTCK